MIYLGFFILMVLYLQKGILSMEKCEYVKTIAGELGEDINLLMERSGFKDISWTMGGKHIVTTNADGSIDIKSQMLKNRLKGMPNGSLTITKSISTDQGVYMANIFFEKKKEVIQCYKVTLYRKLSNSDIEIHYNASRSGPCEVTLTCMVNVPDVTITWTYYNGAKTEEMDHTTQVNYMNINVSHTCTATNLVSRASRTIIPQTFCETEKRNLWHIWISAILCLVMLCAACAILIWFYKKRKYHSGKKPENPISGKETRRFQPSDDNYCEINNLKVLHKKKESEMVYSTVSQPLKKSPLSRRQDVDRMAPEYDTIKMSYVQVL
ncbi:SLAM family member 9-like [Pelobates fuscus]|uniref:SLAM family member 9-like n=1 Tax=Pelobates fuscus TaxID=191477 RepID=UPI002FE4E703